MKEHNVKDEIEKLNLKKFYYEVENESGEIECGFIMSKTVSDVKMCLISMGYEKKDIITIAQVKYERRD